MRCNMFKVGQKVKWLYTQRGGWNLQGWVVGEVKKVTPKRVIVESINKRGAKIQRSLKPENVKHAD